MGLSSDQASAGDNLDWSQVGGSLEIFVPTNGGVENDDDGDKSKQQEQKERRTKGPALKCPRCESTNTKFCYYNNYSKLQPRHFCRACKRHWTAGGTLRSVPVGGGRKNKRSEAGRHRNENNNNVNKVNDKAKANSNINGGEYWQPAVGAVDSNAIFPDVFQQLLFQPQLSAAAPPPATAQLLPGMLQGGENGFYNSCDGCASSSSGSSLHSFTGQELVGGGGGEENLLSLMDGYNDGNGGAGRIEDTIAQPANYWNCWDGFTNW